MPIFQGDTKDFINYQGISPLSTTLQHSSFSINYVLTYSLLTPCSRVIVEKLTSFQLVKKFHTYYGIQRFITGFTSSRHLFLSWASSIHSMPPHPTSWRSILTLSSHLRQGLPHQNHVYTSPLLHTCYISFFLIWSLNLYINKITEYN